MIIRTSITFVQLKSALPKRFYLGAFTILLSISGLTFAGNWNVPVAAQDLKNPTTADTKNLAIAQKIYNKECISCHGPEGLGDGEEQTVEYSLQSVLLTLVEPGNTPISDGELYWKITHGVAKMPSFAGVLTDLERWYMVNHLRALPAAP